MEISVIIVNYNTFNLTCNCIRSVIEHTSEVNYQIILVDNASTECHPDNFLQKFPGIILIRSPINGGFAHANNMGIQHAEGDYILLLNSDTLLIENSLRKSWDYLKSDPHAAALGCRMIYPDGNVQYTARKFRSIPWELLDLFRFIPLLMPYQKRVKLMLGKYFKCDETIECDWVNGAFFMMEKKILNQLPGKQLDDRFFMYGEDQIWCEQIKTLGYKIIFYSGTTIIHIGSGSTDAKKQLALRKVMMKHELKIMELRRGRGTYYFFFAAIYGLKETSRNMIKRMITAATGHLMR